jgi:hypothetical protein
VAAPGPRTPLAEGLAQQVAWQRALLEKALPLRKAVGDEDLIDGGLAEIVDGWTAEDAMRGADVNPLGPGLPRYPCGPQKCNRVHCENDVRAYTIFAVFRCRGELPRNFLKNFFAVSR